jgi:hypothetical protein
LRQRPSLFSRLSHSLYPPFPQLALIVFFRSTLFSVMRLHALTTLLFLLAATLNNSTGTRARPQHVHEQHSRRDMPLARAAKGELDFAAAAKRQAGPLMAAALAPSGSSTSSPSQALSSSQAASAASHAGASTSSSGSAASASGTGMSGSGSSQPTPVVSVPAGANGVPALSLISSGMSTGTPSPVVSTYAPGATPSYPGAPALPAQCTFLLPPLSSCLPLVHRVATHGVGF